MNDWIVVGGEKKCDNESFYFIYPTLSLLDFWFSCFF